MKTVDEIRHDRLLMLRDEYGSTAELSRVVEKSYSQVSQWVNRSISTRNGQPRTMNSETAREFEIKTNKPRGWMDQPIESDKDKVSLSTLGLKREDISLELIEYIELFKKSEQADKEITRHLLDGTIKNKSKKPRKGSEGSNDK